MAKYLLLNPLDSLSLGISYEEIQEAAEEFGCSTITSYSNTKDKTFMYLTAPTIEAMINCINQVDLDGVVVEIGSVFEPAVE